MRVAGAVGQREVQERERRGRRSARSRRAAATSAVWSLVDTEAVDRAAGQDRSKSANFVLVANSAVQRPAPWTTSKTESTGWPAAAARSRPGRSSFHVHAVPAVVRRDPAPGDHAGVVGQGDGLLALRAGVEGRGALAHQPVEGGGAGAARARGSRPGSGRRPRWPARRGAARAPAARRLRRGRPRRRAVRSAASAVHGARRGGERRPDERDGGPRHGSDDYARDVALSCRVWRDRGLRAERTPSLARVRST